MGLFQRTQAQTSEQNGSPPATGMSEKVSKHPCPENPTKKHILPTWHHNGRLHTKGINNEGESGRSGFHIYHFLRIAWRSATPWNTYLNILWPFVPAAIVLHFVYQPKNEHHRAIFATNWLAMIPPASLLGFAGQELARKMPRVIGIITETLLGGVVEIVLFTVLVVKSAQNPNLIPVVKAAILGSILTNLLLCLGACFLVGGLKWKEQKFHPVVSEVGTGLILVAGFALLIPSAFYSALVGRVIPANNNFGLTDPYGLANLQHSTLKISQGCAVVMMVSFFIYIIYSAVSHDSIFDEVLRRDEEIDNDRQRDLAKSKFTLTETVVAIVFCLTCISLIAVFLVLEIEPMVLEYGIPDNFIGLILIPLVEKIAEHITAVDEAYDNQINFALYHCLGPTIQTALFNAPLVVIIGWGLGLATPMDLQFEIFMVVVLILSILVVGNFLRDGASNYLEGFLLLMTYLMIALTTWYYPNPGQILQSDGTLGSEGGEGGAQEAAKLLKRGVEVFMR